MPFPIRTESDQTPARIRPETFAICLLLACSLQIMENLLPKVPVFPWLRLGLAYWVLLPFLIRFGVVQMLALFLLRNLITLIYGGQIFSAFLISTSAGFLSIILFGTLGRWLYQHKVIGLIGLSILLAAAFNVFQLIIVDRLLIQHQDFYFQLAPILFWSLLSGSFIAVLVYKSRSALEQLFESDIELNGNGSGFKTETGSILQIFGGGISLASFCAILLVSDWRLQLAALPCLLLITRLKHLRLILHAWPFYFYIAWLHLFRTDGVFLIGEWVTHEGWQAFRFYAVRTTNIILCGQWLSRYVQLAMAYIRPNRYLQGTAFALPLLPSLFGISIALGKELFARVKQRDLAHLLDPIIQRLMNEFHSLEKR